MPTHKDIVDTFDSYNTYNLLILFNQIKDKCVNHGLNILDNTDYNTEVEFIDLIKNNVNLRQYHENKLSKVKKKS